MDEAAAVQIGVVPIGDVAGFDDSAWLAAAGILTPDFTDAGGRFAAADLSEAELADTAAAAAVPRPPEARVGAALDLVSELAVQANRNTARMLAAVDDALAVAAENPQVFAGPRCAPGRETADFVRRAAVCELAVSLGVSEATVHGYASTAAMLRRSLPGVWALFQDGLLEIAKVRVIVDAADTLPADPTVLNTFDQHITTVAGALPVGKLRQKARSLVERLHPTPAQGRHQKAMDERTFWVQPDRDGMAWLGAHVSADVAVKAKARIDATARHLASIPGESRTLAQLRADACADLLTGAGSPAAVRATVSVTIPVLTLLGQDTPAGYRKDPAVLTGYGPIDPDTARRLCGTAPSLFRLLTDPIDGAILTVDRKSYRPPADLKRLARAVHPICCFPGCNRSAEHSDLDHSLDWLKYGPTALVNLAPLCRHHHRLKHSTRWQMNRDPDTAAISWTAPTGTVHDTDPPPY